MLPLKTSIDGKLLPIKNPNISKVCTPEELVFFFRNCFSPKERKFKMILLAQLGCECRVAEACAINLNDFHKDSNYRKLDMLIQKKAKLLKGKVVGHNEIMEKEMPEAIACHIRAWIKDNWQWILSNQGYIFPPNHMEKELPYCNPRTIIGFMSNKRKQLAVLFQDRNFDKITGWRFYNGNNNKLHGKTPIYLWRTHLMKKFAGTYAYLLTKDAKFVQGLLGHEKLETTQKYYIDSATIMQQNSVEKIKNKLFDIGFYESIKQENENIPAVWDLKPKKIKH